MTTRNYSFQSAVSSPNHVGAHLTILYLGEQDVDKMEAIPINRLYKYMTEEFSWPTIIKPNRDLGVQMFGTENNVPVYPIEESTRLIFIRALAEHFFNEHNIYSTSEFTEYKPHITLQEKNNVVDDKVTDDIMLYFPHLVSWEIPVPKDSPDDE